MLATIRSALSRRSARAARCRRHVPAHRLLAEPLESRLMLSGSSWVASTELPTTLVYLAATDQDGGVYMANTRDGGTATSHDIWLSKYSPTGNWQWTNDLQLPDGQNVFGLAAGQDGVYIGGGFVGITNFDPEGSSEGVLESVGVQSGYVAKYALDDGAFIWARKWSDTSIVINLTVSSESVFITGRETVPVNDRDTRTDMFVAKLASDGSTVWDYTIQEAGGNDIDVLASPSQPARIYVAGDHASTSKQPFVAKLSESADLTGVSLDWRVDTAAHDNVWTESVAVSTEEIGGAIVPSVYTIIVSDTYREGNLVKISDTGDVLWSTPITGTGNVLLNGLAVANETVFVGGRFEQDVDLDANAANPLVSSRGNWDAFLARYDSDGHLTAAQRMGGTGRDSSGELIVANNHVYYPGISRSIDGDYPASLPGQSSAFVPATTTPGNVFLMQLDVDAPIVYVAETDIAVAEGTPITLSADVALAADATAFNVTWYEANQPLATGGSVELVLNPGRHLISAVATDNLGRIGMAGVVVNVGMYTSTDTPKQMADAHPSKGAGLTTSQITVPSTTSVTAIGTLKVDLNIAHSAPSQLKAVLVGPDGTPETLFDRPSALQATYETTLYVGKPLFGTWTLRLEDHVRGTTGTLNSWSITASPQVVQNLPPVANDDSYTVSWNQTLTVAAPGVLANDSDPNGDTLTAEWVEGPTYGTLSFNGDGSFRYTPVEDFVGIDEFTYEVSDGEFYRAATVSIHVVNRDPIAVNDGYSTAFNTPLQVLAPGVLANDSDPDGDPLTAVLLSGLNDSSSGTLTWAGDGSFTFTPAEGYDGTVSFTYQVTDNGGLVSNVATVTINVAPEEGQELTFSSTDVPKTIADPHPTQGVRMTISRLVIADTEATIGSLFRLDLAISHSRPADLSAVLRSPGNIEAVVFPQGTATLPTQWTTDAFAGQPLDGTWQLILRDHVRGTTGTLTAWSITASVESGGGLLTLSGQGDDQSLDKLRGMLASDATLGDHEGFFDDASNTDDAVRMLYDVDDLPDEFLRVGTPDRVATGALDRLMARLDRPAAQPLDEVLEELFPK